MIEKIKIEDAIDVPRAHEVTRVVPDRFKRRLSWPWPLQGVPTALFYPVGFN
jgi:hypothetical protein